MFKQDAENWPNLYMKSTSYSSTMGLCEELAACGKKGAAGWRPRPQGFPAVFELRLFSHLLVCPLRYPNLGG